MREDTVKEMSCKGAEGSELKDQSCQREQPVKGMSFKKV